MIYEINGKPYIKANGKYYALKLEKDDIKAVFEEVIYDLPKDSIVIPKERAVELLKGKTSKNANKDFDREI